jgi:hypothetical protein
MDERAALSHLTFIEETARSKQGIPTHRYGAMAESG